jgi:hypothetical protein
MKKVLSLVGGIVFVLSFGIAHAGDLQTGDGYTSDKMIRDEDIRKYDQDMGSGTFNQMPALPEEREERGSAPGGVSEDRASDGKSDTFEKATPVEKDKTKPSESGEGMGGPSRGWNPYSY